jgi:hypothetical protein
MYLTQGIGKSSVCGHGHYSVAGSGQPVAGFFLLKDALIADTQSTFTFNRSVLGPGFFLRFRFLAFAILGCFWFDVTVHQTLARCTLNRCYRAVTVVQVAGVPTEIKFSNVAVQMLLADRVKDSGNAALQNGKRRFRRVGVDAAIADIFPPAMIHPRMTA